MEQEVVLCVGWQCVLVLRSCCVTDLQLWYFHVMALISRALRISLLREEGREREGMTQKYACDRNLLILLVSKLSSSVTKKHICPHTVYPFTICWKYQKRPYLRKCRLITGTGVPVTDWLMNSVQGKQRPLLQKTNNKHQGVCVNTLAYYDTMHNKFHENT